ncbi:MAG: NfeD family protein [Humibacillus sp.]|nr:NfeD family protein [Humibacillus sp.]MDN5776021.1 NfeD family protein [Humibacillus sp.]
MFDGQASLVWLGLVLVLVAIEAVTVDFTFLMIGGGALGGSVAAALGAPFAVQAVVFVIVATGLLLVVRPWMHRRFSRVKVPAMGTSAHLGRSAVVIDRVSDSSGTVKLAGETWTARTVGDGIETGQEVVVDRIDGATAVVSRVPDVEL